MTDTPLRGPPVRSATWLRLHRLHPSGLVGKRRVMNVFGLKLAGGTMVAHRGPRSVTGDSALLNIPTPPQTCTPFSRGLWSRSAPSSSALFLKMMFSSRSTSGVGGTSSSSGPGPEVWFWRPWRVMETWTELKRNQDETENKRDLIQCAAQTNPDPSEPPSAASESWSSIGSDASWTGSGASWF